MFFTSGKLAKLADGCATVTFGDTSIMATAVSKEKKANAQFVPLSVSYQQKAAALGRIPLNYFRREMGQSETEILTSRMIDRSVRPLFPRGFTWDTQVVCNPLALDGNNYPDVVAINAASAALAVSDIPWNGPVGAVRLGLIKDTVLVNPTKKELAESVLNVVMTCTEKKYVLMLECSAANVLIPDFLKTVKLGLKECYAIVNGIKELRNRCGKTKRTFEQSTTNEEWVKDVMLLTEVKLMEIFYDHSHNKLSRDNAVVELQESTLKSMLDRYSDADPSVIKEIFHDVCKSVFRKMILEKGVRCDGRKMEDIREIKCQVDLFKPLHGSALFQRGQTQVLCTVALDSPNAAMKIDKVAMIMSGLKEKNFFVHYNFPPFATKEIGRIGTVGRREVGHGALAEKALKAIVPNNFPFTIRLTSEVLESNGSSSMATVCGGSLALMDAGVAVEEACAGVAMGLIADYSETDPSEMTNYKILSDLVGIEDHFGDMDFKIAGTKRALTAIQMDVKNMGLPLKVLSEILSQSKSAISVILRHMNAVCPVPRFANKENWPAVYKVNVPLHLRSKFIGTGGVNLKKMEFDLGVEITEESPGEFHIFANSKEVLAEVQELVRSFLEGAQEVSLEFGGVYPATIVEVRPSGCLVSLHPSMEPVLLHISQLDVKKVDHPSVLGMEVGQEIKVKYFGRDPVSGMIRLSRKVLQGMLTQVATTLPRRDIVAQENTETAETGETAEQKES